MTFGTPPLPSRRLPPATAGFSVSQGKPITVEERERIDAATDEVAARMADLDRMLERLRRSERS